MVISKNEEVGVSKKLSFLKIDECDPGDVCWIVLKNYSKPILATIQSKIEIENAVSLALSINDDPVASLTSLRPKIRPMSFRRNNKTTGDTNETGKTKLYF